jgi:outer membrane protein TolC
MKAFFLSILILFLSGILTAQQRGLDFYLDQAKINSPLINQNKNQHKIINLDLEQVRSMLSKSEINVESNVLFAPIISHDNNSNRFEWVSKGADDYNGYDLASTDGGQYQAYVSIRQPLFRNSMYRSYSNKADISHKINENNIALTIHELEYLVGYQYILCLQSKILAENRKSLLERLDEQMKIFQKLVENAIYNQTDLMLLQIEYQNYMVEYRTFQSEYQNNLYDLNLMSGINDTTLVDVQEINLQLKPDTLANSRFLTTYKLDSLNTMADQSIFMLKYKPLFNLFADAGLNAVYQPGFNRLGFSTGLNLTWNIFDGNQGKIQKEKSIIDRQTIEFDKKYFVTQNTVSKYKILNQINLLDQRIMLLEQQLNQYDKLFDVYREELPMNMISVMDFKILLNDMAASKQGSLMLKMEKQMLINSYNYWNY